MTFSDDVRSGLVRETADLASQTADRVRSAAGHAGEAASEAASGATAHARDAASLAKDAAAHARGTASQAMESAGHAIESAGQAKEWVLATVTPARAAAQRRGRRRQRFVLIAVLVAALGAGVAAWRRSRASEPAWESVPTGWPASGNGASGATPAAAEQPGDDPTEVTPSDPSATDSSDQVVPKAVKPVGDTAPTT